MAIKFTAAVLAKVKYDPNGSKIQRIWDLEVGGLGFESYKTGRQSWIFRYRIHGKQRFITVGAKADLNLNEAREKVITLRADVRKGEDPHVAKEAAAKIKSLDDLYEDYISSKKFGKLSPDFKIGMKSTYKKYLKKPFGHYPIDGIKRADIKKLVEDLINEGFEGAARGLISRAKILFNWGIEEEHCENNPADRFKPTYTTTGKRDTWLDTDERVKNAWYFKGCIQARSLVRWLLLTGCRRDEARNARWDQFEDGVWRIAKTKSKAPLVLPVTDEMQAVLDELKATFDSEWLFPATTTESKQIPRGSLHYLLEKHSDFTPHEVRHTVATRMSDLKIDRPLISLVLNHSDRTMTARYNHSEQLEIKKDALNIWHKELICLVG